MYKKVRQTNSQMDRYKLDKKGTQNIFCIFQKPQHYTLYIVCRMQIVDELYIVDIKKDIKTDRQIARQPDRYKDRYATILKCSKNCEQYVDVH